MIRFKKGSVWQCDLPILGGKRRPCVIISDDEFNRSNESKVVNVVPLSTSLDVDSDNARHLQMKIINDKLCQPLVEYVYPCSKTCFQNFVGFLDEDEMASIETAFAKHFSNVKGWTMTSIKKRIAESEPETTVEEPKAATDNYKIGTVKYTDEEKRKIIDAYDKAMKDKDRNMLQRLADIYGKGSLNKLANNVSYYRKCLRK